MQAGTLETIEQVSGLSEMAIREVRWIKPTRLRSPGQRTAIAIFGFATQEGANQAIRHGLFVEGKKVWGRKQMQELRRCLKCQSFGVHKAAKCALIHEVCGWCGKLHRTNECQETQQEGFECSNCKTSKNGRHKGHGASDRQCPVFIERARQINQRCQENRYKYFCTTDPETWENTDEYARHGDMNCF